MFTARSSSFRGWRPTSRTGEKPAEPFGEPAAEASGSPALTWTSSDRRYHEYGKSPSPTSSTSSTSGSGRFESRVPDVATVPDHDSLKLSQHLHPGPQDHNGVLNMTVAPPTKPGVISHHIYGPYAPEQPLGQWSGPGAAQYPPSHHLTPDYATQAVHHGYHHGNVAEWSQYPLFSYSCW